MNYIEKLQFEEEFVNSSNSYWNSLEILVDIYYISILL